MILRRLSLLLLTLLFALSLPAFGQGGKAKDKRLVEAEKKIEQIRSHIKSLEEGAGNAETQLRLVTAEIAARDELLAVIVAQQDSLKGEIRSAEHCLDSLNHRADTLRTSFNQLVRTAYKTRSSKHWYLYIFSGETFSQGVRRARYMRSIGERLNAEAQRLQEVQQETEAQLRHLDTLRSETDAAASALVTEREKLRKTKKDAEKLVASIKRDQKTYKNKLKQAIEERDRLKKEIDKALAEASKKSSSKASSDAKSGKGSSKGKSGKTEVDASLLGGQFDAKSNKGKLPWPAKGVVIESYGKNVDPVYYTTLISDGITLSTAPGAEIRAIYEGVVTSVAKTTSKFNYIVIIQHGGNFRTLYCYLDDNIGVKEGDRIATGQLLGHAVISGSTSLVHFQIRDASNHPVDPTLWLAK